MEMETITVAIWNEYAAELHLSFHGISEHTHTSYWLF
jgi:hypothetical protein